MSDSFKVQRHELKKHAVALDKIRERWTTDIPASLNDLYTDGDEYTIAGDDFVSSLLSLRDRYSNTLIPGIAVLMAEVVSALQSVAKNYGDAEAASTVSRQGERIPTHQIPGDPSDIGNILGGSVRS
ncbi:hypothetical protein [Actinoallomurus liliacearum]